MRRLLLPVLVLAFVVGLAACDDAAPETRSGVAPGADATAGDATAGDATAGDAAEPGAGCVCAAGRAGKPVWCEACDRGYVDGKEVSCPACVERGVKAAAKAAGAE